MSTRRLIAQAVVAGSAVAAVLAPPAAAGRAAAPPEDLVHPSLPGRLSDERTLTRWATVVDEAPVRRRPDPGAPAVARLRHQTEDRLPEVYVGLEQAVGADGEVWVRVRVPMRPNGTTGWVQASELNPWRISDQVLRVSRGRRTAVLYRAGRPVWRSRVGVGKPATPTPAGSFYVRERIRNLGGSPVYGPLAFGTSAYSRLSDWPGGGVIGIHGTDRPELIPGRVSHGCIRVPNRALERLARRLTVGTPVQVVDGSPRLGAHP